MVLKLPIDFAKKISEVLAISEQGVDQLFEVEEDKAGFFVAKLKPRQFLEKEQFKTMCALARDLGGEGYLQGAKAWRIPGPFVRKSSEVPSGQETDFLATHKQPGNAVPTEPSSKPPFFMLPVKNLLSMPFQCREGIGEGEKFGELVESIRTLGVLQPIVVRQKASGSFEIVAGERRVAACKRLGIAEIPANVKVLSDQEAYEVQIVENVQREDLSDTEKARMLDMMINQFGYLQKDLAKKLGKSEGWVSRHLAMLQVNILAPGQVRTGEITEKQARELVAASPEKREEILDKANEEGALPSARKMEEMRKSVSCARCGDATSVPVNLGSSSSPKFYCGECAEAVVAEAKAGHGPSLEPGSGEGKVGEKEETKGEGKEPSRREQLKAVQIGEFECTECHQRFMVDHMPNGKHKLHPIREAEEK